MNEDQDNSVEARLKRIEDDLKGTSKAPGVFENLRQLQKLVKISIAVSVLGAGSSTVNWEALLKLLT